MEQVAPPKNGKDKKTAIGLAIALGITLLVTACVLLSTVRLYGVGGASMKPTLPDGSLVLTCRLGYRPRQGDIIAFQQPYNNEDMLMVKRVIAVGGQTVDIDYAAGTVSVDGKVLNEPYVNSEPMLEPPFEHLTTVTVPENSVFILGDNRNHSVDSRNPRLGCIELGNIKGKVIWSFRLGGAI